MPNLKATMQQILLIEDDMQLAEMLREYLGGAGFAVSHAASGGAGLKLHARDGFDAIVLDVINPTSMALRCAAEWAERRRRRS